MRLRAAVQEGIVIGGGAALVEAYKELKPVLKSDNQLDCSKRYQHRYGASHGSHRFVRLLKTAGYNCEDIVDAQEVADKNVGFDAKAW